MSQRYRSCFHSTIVRDISYQRYARKHAFYNFPTAKIFKVDSMLREFPSRLSTVEAGSVLLFISAIYYVFLLGGLDSLLSSIVTLKDSQIVWRSEGGLWDHPEPNYKVFPFVAEFFASATAIPLAGGFLLYQALRFSYNKPVLVLYLLDCWMYTCAFFAHMLLWPLLNSVTLTSVLTNALYTFSIYAGLAGGPLKKPSIRFTFTVLMWFAIVYMVAVLPPWFGQNGGVPALLTIQTPAVICALAGAFYCSRNLSRLTPGPNNADAQKAFKFLCVSGILLCSAMAVSLVEVLFGKYCQARYFGIVPVFHIVIHILEQIGIYLYGVGVATIEHVILPKFDSSLATPRIEYVFGGYVPYLAITVLESPAAATSSNEPKRRTSPRLSQVRARSRRASSVAKRN